MKQITISVLLFVFMLNSKGQQATSKYPVPIYRFKNLSIIVGNTAMADSAKETRSAYIRFPLKEQVFYTYSPYLQVLVSTLTHPCPDSNTAIRIYTDTSVKDNELMKLADLESQTVIKNNPLQEKGWRDIVKLPKENYINSTTRYDWDPYISNRLPLKHGDYYQLVTQFITAYFNTTVVIRNKRTKEELIRLRFIAIGPPVTPFLDMWTTDFTDGLKLDANTRPTGSVGYVAILDSNQQARDYSQKLRNETLQKVTNLILHFKSPSWDYPDSSLEFRLLNKSAIDTFWKKTGHVLALTKLEPDVHYTLQIRYIIHPAYMQEHKFYIVPQWYQTTIFKILFVLSLICIFLVFLLTVYRRRILATRRKKEQLSLETKAIRSQLNPHFVFNALGSIQNLINKNDINDANEYLTRFSSLLRETLDSNRKEFIPLATEIVILDTYLKLEQLRSDFDYHIYIDDAINKNAIEVPTLLLQPLVENAIKHGISEMEGKGIIKIQFQQKMETLIVVITDNGKGFDPTNSFSGIGLSLTRDRIRLLNQFLKNQSIKMDIKSKKNTGTTVHLIFQNWL